MNVQRDTWTFPTAHVGRRVLVFGHLPSTNDLAHELAADPANAGLAVVADYQTAGRGQYGRVWQSDTAVSLLLSVVVPPHPPARPGVLTAWAAVAVADAVVELTGVLPRVKWPNDVLVGGKKVCGILIEQRQGVVVGLGLNLAQAAEQFAAQNLPDAGSLLAVSGRSVSQRDAAAAVLSHLDAGFRCLRDADLGPLEAAWRDRLALVGRDVIAIPFAGDAVTGRLVSLSFDEVRVETAGGGFAGPPEQLRGLIALS